MAPTKLVAVRIIPGWSSGQWLYMYLCRSVTSALIIEVDQGLRISAGSSKLATQKHPTDQRERQQNSNYQLRPFGKAR